MTPSSLSKGFLKIREVMAQRLKRGAQNRQELALALHNGEVAHGHRLEWLIAASKTVLESLIKTAKEFNSKYPEERISVRDMEDVLMNTIDKLKNK